MLDLTLLEGLRGRKNLLAFSYGSDSTTLFYLLVRAEIDFDLALINYKTRPQSDSEEVAAKLLASEFNKQIRIKTAPKFKNNFEKNARDFRYDFFNELCLEFDYENLILAHNLNDKLEWFLMQLTRGAGLLELLGMNAFEKRQNYNIIRPLINSSKREIMAFLKTQNIKFFKDESNENEKYFRNFIRKNYANSFVGEFENGLKKSFEYLSKDLSTLTQNAEITDFEGILISPINESLIAKCVKKLGIVMSAKQRLEALQKDCVISHKIGICYYLDYALIFFYESALKIPKQSREKYRLARLPKLLRPYFFNHNLDIVKFKKKLQEI